MITTSIPEYIRETPRQFAARKRKDARLVLKAIGDLRRGSAFVPAGEEIYAMEKLAEECVRALAVQRWRVERYKSPARKAKVRA